MDLPASELRQLQSQAAGMDLEQVREALVEHMLEGVEWTKRGHDSQAELSEERASVFFTVLKEQSALTSLAPLLSSGIPALEYEAAAALAETEPTGAFRDAAVAKLEELSARALGYLSGWSKAILNRMRFDTPFPSQAQLDAYDAAHGR